MKVRLTGCVALVACLALMLTTTWADDVKSGPDKKIGGPFDVKAITGELKGKQLCYVCKYNGEARPAVVLIFTRLPRAWPAARRPPNGGTTRRGAWPPGSARRRPGNAA